MIITNQTDVDYWFGPMHLPPGSGTGVLVLDDTSDTSLYLLNDEVADAVNTLYLSSQITVSSAASPFPRPTGTPSLLHGDGSPEGLVYGPQGSLQLRRDSVQGNTGLYTKTTGVTLNTGWASVLGPAPGDLKPSGATSAPGWLLCDGTAYPTATYPSLFEAIGYTYGNSGGLFSVPDLRGRLPIGAGTGTASGATSWTLGNQPTTGAGGEQTHTLVTGEMPNHTHAPLDIEWAGEDLAATFLTGAGDGGDGSNWEWVFGNIAFGDAGDQYGVITNPNDIDSDAIMGGSSTTDASGDDEAHNILPPVSVVNWFIKT